MTNEQQIERLWELQRSTSEQLQAIADQMATIAKSNITIPQDRWDQLFKAWEDANSRMQEVGRELQKIHRV